LFISCNISSTFLLSGEYGAASKATNSRGFFDDKKVGGELVEAEAEAGEVEEVEEVEEDAERALPMLSSSSSSSPRTNLRSAT
jgi:hypothetical protein